MDKYNGALRLWQGFAVRTAADIDDATEDVGTMRVFLREQTERTWEKTLARQKKGGEL